ncbi:MAG: FAD:protein FMN transferase [Flavobacteriales bacterium]
MQKSLPFLMSFSTKNRVFFTAERIRLATFARMKRYSFLIIILLFAACGQQPFRKMNVYGGYAQGTTFNIVYDSNAGDLQADIDAIFKTMDASMSLWDSASVITRINNSVPGTPVTADDHFAKVYALSDRIHKETDGAFNPCVYPLIKFWGFSKERFSEDSLKSKQFSVDSLRRHSAWGMVKPAGGLSYVRMSSRAGIDFNAIAQGYTVDVICDLFQAKNVQNYMVEVGGEVRAKGTNQKEKTWKIGIDKPISDSGTRELQAIVDLDGLALATSGSYRKFYEKNGRRYSHTIDPRTGMPVEHKLLSASVFAPTCAEADAYATAFMVMGAGKAVHFVERHPSLMVYLISDAFNGEYEIYMSPALKNKISDPSK